MTAGFRCTFITAGSSNTEVPSRPSVVLYSSVTTVVGAHMILQTTIHRYKEGPVGYCYVPNACTTILI